MATPCKKKSAVSSITITKKPQRGEITKTWQRHVKKSQQYNNNKKAPKGRNRQNMATPCKKKSQAVSKRPCDFYFLSKKFFFVYKIVCLI
jgi:hypothetical protein